jgi:hypothetical protein
MCQYVSTNWSTDSDKIALPLNSHIVLFVDHPTAFQWADGCRQFVVFSRVYIIKKMQCCQNEPTTVTIANLCMGMDSDVKMSEVNINSSYGGHYTTDFRTIMYSAFQSTSNTYGCVQLYPSPLRSRKLTLCTGVYISNHTFHIYTQGQKYYLYYHCVKRQLFLIVFIVYYLQLAFHGSIK